MTRAARARRRVGLVLAAAALAAATAWWVGPWRAGDRAPVPPDRGRDAPRSSRAAPERAAPASGTGAAAPDAETEAAAPDAAAPWPVTIPNLAPLVDLGLKQAPSGRDWDFRAYRAATETPDAVDADTAYAAFQYLDSCIGVPRTEREFERRLERLQTMFEQQQRRLSEERFERIVDHQQSGYLRCAGLGEIDLVAAALDWLQLAADRGHLLAQLTYYRELPELLRRSPGRLFREPAYLDRHRAKSLEYFARALETGHPQAFLAYAEAILDDVLYEPDPIAAYAHLHAGDLAAGGALEGITKRMRELEARLTAGDLRVARAWGRELCLRWCRGQDP